MKRRDVIKGLSLVPFIGTTPVNAFSEPVSVKGIDRNFMEEIGITPVINARGGWTFMSGPIMVPEALEAINSVSDVFFNMFELNVKVGNKIADMLGCEAATVTSGSACGMLIGTAATITGTDQIKIELIPNLPGPQREVIVQKSHRVTYDHAVRNCGVKMIEVENVQQLEQAVNKNTVMMLFMHHARNSGQIKEEEFVALGKKHSIPTFIDAAGAGKQDLFKYPKMGFDLMSVSGGKAIRGPQSAGLLIGRKDLIHAARLNHSPYNAPIGRPAKVNKEEIFGMYAALKAFLERDPSVDKREREEGIERANRIKSVLSVLPSVDCGTGNSPGFTIRWDENRIAISPRQVYDALANGSPKIETGGHHPEQVRDEYISVAEYPGLEMTAHRQGKLDGITISVSTLRPNEDKIVGNRLKEILQKAII